MKYGNLTLGQIEALVNKIGGEKEVMRLLRNELEVHEVTHQFPLWRTIKLYNGLHTAYDLQSALKAGGHLISERADGFISRLRSDPTKEETRIDLVIVSMIDLGFERRAPFKDVCKRALELGLVLCPIEAGPQICLQCADQLVNKEWLVIVTNPDKDFGGASITFHVIHNPGRLCLDAEYTHMDYCWDINKYLVFARSYK